MKVIIYKLSIGLGLSCSIALAGCAQSAQSQQQNTASSNAVATTACQKNTFLQRYGCSLERVEQAAETNDPDAEYALGYMYYNGIGTVRDPDTAVIWIKRAAQQGQPLAISAMTAIRQAQFPKIGQVHVQHDTPAVQVHVASIKRQTKTAAIKPVASSQKTPALLKAAVEKRFQDLPKNNFMIQLFASHTHAHAVAYAHKMLPTVPFYIVPTMRGTTQTYLLLVGNFTDHAKAEAYAHTLSEKLQATHPWVRQIGQIQVVTSSK